MWCYTLKAWLAEMAGLRRGVREPWYFCRRCAIITSQKQGKSKAMRLSSSRLRGYFCLLTTWAMASPALPVIGQDKPPENRSIDLDKELSSPVPEDRAKSYYYYALSKWFEDKGDMARALTEMKSALK